MNGDGGVNDVWLDCLFLDNRLDGLVHVVVDMLASYRGRNTLGVSFWCANVLIFELGSFNLKLAGNILLVAVVVFSVLDRLQVVMMLLW